MSNVSLTRVLQRLRGLVERPGAGESVDAQLLERFTATHDEAAFAELVRRHGPLVLRVCRQILRREHDAEDAFQATFLVLACKAASVRRAEALAGWLHRVAYHAAVQSRGRASRQRQLEQQAAVGEADARTAPRGESWPEVHEEVNRLPQKYRVPVILCYLEGHSHEEAARVLGWPLGTVKVRLTRAQALLHRRLTRRGVTLAAGLGALSAGTADAAVPAALAQRTVEAAIAFMAGHAAAAGMVPATALVLAKGVLRSMFVRKIKTAVVVLTLLALGAGSAGWFWPGTDAADPGPVPAPAAQRRHTWRPNRRRKQSRRIRPSSRPTALPWCRRTPSWRVRCTPSCAAGPATSASRRTALPRRWP